VRPAEKEVVELGGESLTRARGTVSGCCSHHRDEEGFNRACEQEQSGGCKKKEKSKPRLSGSGGEKGVRRDKCSGEAKEGEKKTE